MTDTYLTIFGSSEGFYSEKRSKFYAFAHHVETAEEVKTLLDGYRKRYHDARHVCWAYRLTPSGEDYRYNDDGEPSSTAGKPIHGQLLSHGLTDVAVFVVRYYGGINLGTSGLIVAYREATADALSHATTQERLVEETIEYSFAYVNTDRVLKIVRQCEARILSQTYDNTCTFRLAIRQSRAEEFKRKLSEV